MLSEEEMDKIDDEFGNIPLLSLARLYRFIQENYVSKNKIQAKIKEYEELDKKEFAKQGNFEIEIGALKEVLEDKQ